MLFSTAVVFGWILAISPAPARGEPVDPLSLPKLPPTVTLPVLQNLLQDFVNAAYGTAFSTLGDERDFDHGHLLLDLSGRPIAVLYHTQELTYKERPAIGPVLDPAARNWIEWLDNHKIEDARRYVRHSYPPTATWDWFRSQRLPLLEARHTILDKMLDPALLGVDISESRQWVFTRRPCAPTMPESSLRVLLPTKEEICLALSAY